MNPIPGGRSLLFVRIEQLEYIAAVTRLGSLRRAAEELHLSQPALSETVRHLERELGVDLLERKRSGAKISDEGRELLPHIMSVLDAVGRLRGAAGDQHRVSRMVRLGTVNTATVPLVIPTVREFRASHPVTQVELVGAQQADIHRGLLDGAFDLGLVNYLRGDDMPPGFETTELLCGRPVVCVRPDSPLAAMDAVDADSLLAEPLVVMRSGYVMHRFVHRLLRGRTPSFSYSTDGAEMGKLMVAEGLGAIGGLPGTGKATLARLLAARIGAVHLRVDTIEQAIVRSGRAPAPRDRTVRRHSGPAVAELAAGRRPGVRAVGTQARRRRHLGTEPATVTGSAPPRPGTGLRWWSSRIKVFRCRRGDEAGRAEASRAAGRWAAPEHQLGRRECPRRRHSSASSS